MSDSTQVKKMDNAAIVTSMKTKSDALNVLRVQMEQQRATNAPLATYWTQKRIIVTHVRKAIVLIVKMEYQRVLNVVVDSC